MFISIHRLKAANQGGKIIILFNSLDQLSARFPLCAKQEIFVPGIIETLAGEGITGIFIAVEEPGQPVEQYGLLPMADLILSFQPHRFAFEDYYGHLNEKLHLSQTSAQVSALREASRNTNKDLIVLQVVRHAGGHAAGDKGLLELIESEEDCKSSFYPKQGLHFVPLSARHDCGVPLVNGTPMRAS